MTPPSPGPSCAGQIAPAAATIPRRSTHAIERRSALPGGPPKLCTTYTITTIAHRATHPPPSSAVSARTGRQRDRRNLTRQELAAFIVRAMEALDNIKPQGQRTDLAQDCAKSQAPASERKSSVATAEKIGVSARTVEMARAVMASDVAPVKEALRNGTTTVNGAYKAGLVQDRTRPADPNDRKSAAETAENLGARRDSLPTPPIVALAPATLHRLRWAGDRPSAS